MTDQGSQMTPEQLLRTSQLTPEQLADIDAAVIGATSAKSWRKLARVVGAAIIDQPNHQDGVPDLYYAQRVRQLAADGQLLIRGDPFDFGRCEVRAKPR